MIRFRFYNQHRAFILLRTAKFTALPRRHELLGGYPSIPCTDCSYRWWPFIEELKTHSERRCRVVARIGSVEGASLLWTSADDGPITQETLPRLSGGFCPHWRWDLGHLDGRVVLLVLTIRRRGTPVLCGSRPMLDSRPLRAGFLSICPLIEPALQHNRPLCEQSLAIGPSPEGMARIRRVPSRR